MIDFHKNSYFSLITTIVFTSFLIIFSSFASISFAHPMSVSYGEIVVQGNEIHYTFSIDDFSVLESTRVDQNGNYLLEDFEVRDGEQEIMQWLMSRLRFAIDNEEIRPTYGELSYELIGDNQMVIVPFVIPFNSGADRFVLEDHLYEKTENKNNYTQFITVIDGEQTSEVILKGKNRDLQLPLPTNDEGSKQSGVVSPQNTWIQFFLLGMEHIISGYDHLLFLIALLFMKQSIRGYIGIITAFTIAHSITLTLGYFDVVMLPSLFVEATIALSICYVAFENIVRKQTRKRWIVTFIFGLIHGLGFAGVLSEMNISNSHLVAALFSFNMGIEVIQVLLVLLVIPILMKLQKSSHYKKIMQIASVAVFIMGVVWLIERVV